MRRSRSERNSSGADNRPKIALVVEPSVSKFSAENEIYRCACGRDLVRRGADGIWQLYECTNRKCRAFYRIPAMIPKRKRGKDEAKDNEGDEKRADSGGTTRSKPRRKSSRTRKTRAAVDRPVSGRKQGGAKSGARAKATPRRVAK